MATLINLYNQAGAGPKTLSLNFIHYLSAQVVTEPFYILVPDYQEYALLESDIEYIQFIKLPRKEKLLGKIWFRLYLEFIFIPRFVKKHDIKRLLAFGSFLLTPGKFMKLVLIHHPYLFDNQLLSRAPLKTRIQEYLKRIVFYLTLSNTKHLVVESKYVADSLQQTWGNFLNNNTIHVIPNPVSDQIGKLEKSELEIYTSSRFSQITAELKILFVSRFYPHKNHQFLVDLSKSLSLHSIKHEILITVSEQIPEARPFLKSISTQNLRIKNLGEMNQAQLQSFYKSSHLFIFPSKSETFGIPMIEAMAYGLPLVLPKLGYAEAIAGFAGNYYESDDTEACCKVISDLTSEFISYRQRSVSSFDELNHFPTPKAWVNSYLNTLQISSN